MKLTDEAKILLERISAANYADKELAEATKSLAELLARISGEIDKINGCLESYEETANLLSDVVIGLQDKIGTAEPQQITGLEPSDINSYLRETEDDAEQYIHCPYCNTLIFVSDMKDDDITCPFCNEKFKKEDAGL